MMMYTLCAMQTLLILMMLDIASSVKVMKKRQTQHPSHREIEDADAAVYANGKQIPMFNDVHNRHQFGNQFDALPQIENIWTHDHVSMSLPDKIIDIEAPESDDEDEEDVDEDETDNSNDNGDGVNSNVDHVNSVKSEVDQYSKSSFTIDETKRRKMHPQLTTTPATTTTTAIAASSSSSSLSQNWTSITESSRSVGIRNKASSMETLILEKGLVNLTRNSGENIRMKCTFRGHPLPSIKWFKNEAPVDEIRGKLDVRILASRINGRTSSRLRINQLDTHDTGYYKCEARSGHRTMETIGILKVFAGSLQTQIRKSNFLPDYPQTDPHFPGLRGASSPEISESNKYGKESASTTTTTAYCEPYKGSICSQFIGNTSIYVKSDASQTQMEAMLNDAFNKIATSHSISPKCHRFAIPFLCYFVFPFCDRTHLDNVNVNGLMSGRTQPFPRKVCRDECEILKIDICKEEFTKAKHKLRKQILPNCEQLPGIGSVDDKRCIRLGVPSSVQIVQDQSCYNGKGEDYRGIVSYSIHNKKCEIWQLSQFDANYGELIGGHNYCRNPGGLESAPFCYIYDGEVKKDLCDIPKCVNYFWIYYIVTPCLATISLIVFICCARRCIPAKSTQANNDQSLPLTYRPPMSNHRHQQSSPALNSSEQSLQIAYRSPQLASQINIRPQLSPAMQTNYNGESVSSSSFVHRPPSSPALSKNSSRRETAKSYEMRSLLPDNTYPPLCAIKFDNEIGDSIFGKILKGELLTPNGVIIPITALTMQQSNHAQADDIEFKNEAELLCSLQHPNIV